MFDDITPALGISRLDVLKIDVEGAELMVLKGSKKLIVKYKPLIMLEINNDTYQSAGYTIQDIKDFFRSLNYSCYLITKGGKLISSKSTPAFCNAVFIYNENI